MSNLHLRVTRRAALQAGALAVLGVGAFFVTRAYAGEGSYENRAALARDIVRLAIVVMANQTPISAVVSDGHNNCEKNQTAYLPTQPPD